MFKLFEIWNLSFWRNVLLYCKVLLNNCFWFQSCRSLKRNKKRTCSGLCVLFYVFLYNSNVRAVTIIIALRNIFYVFSFINKWFTLCCLCFMLLWMPIFHMCWYTLAFFSANLYLLYDFDNFYAVCIQLLLKKAC